MCRPSLPGSRACSTRLETQAAAGSVTAGAGVSVTAAAAGGFLVTSFSMVGDSLAPMPRQ